MKEDKILRKTKQIMTYTDSVIENSKKLRKPSARIDKIGTMIGTGVSIILIGAGIVQFVIGNPLWAALTVVFGVVALTSNCIHYYQVYRKN
ncbi:MAG: hypothetical protein KH135_04610 [Firmicutes bacterium]|nr:hypothetical protein [Bacillota bacterium]